MIKAFSYHSCCPWRMLSRMSTREALNFCMALADTGKETLTLRVLSPHFYMAHADVRKEAALGALSPEVRYERAGVRDVATLPLLLTDSDMFLTPYTKSD